MFLCFLTLHWPRGTVRTNTYMGYRFFYRNYTIVYIWTFDSWVEHRIASHCNDRSVCFCMPPLHWRTTFADENEKKNVNFNHVWNDWLEIFICEVRCAIWCFPAPCWYRTPLTGQHISRVVVPCIITLL